MIATGWISEPHELPASQHLRSVAEILSAPMTSPEERAAERHERAEAEERRARAADLAASAEAAAFMARMNGTAARNPLAEAAIDPFRDMQAVARRRAAIDALRPLRLSDVITGGQSGVVIDANMGVLEPPQDTAPRAAMDRQYEFERSQRLAKEGRAVVRQARAKLDARWRARGIGPRVSHRPAAPGAEAVYRRACAEIGCPVGDDVRFR